MCDYYYSMIIQLVILNLMTMITLKILTLVECSICGFILLFVCLLLQVMLKRNGYSFKLDKMVQFMTKILFLTSTKWNQNKYMYFA